MNNMNVPTGNDTSGHNHFHDIAVISTGRLIFVTALNVVITIAEVIGGILSGSLSLLSDALHNLSDVMSLILSYAALAISGKKRTISKSYGYKRAQILAAFFNSAVLLVISLFLMYEAFKRLGNPEKLDGMIMMIVAAIGLAANLISAVALKKVSQDNMNIKSSYFHLLADTLSSAGVLAGGIAIKLWNVLWVDPVITIAVSLYITYETYKIVKNAVDILMQSSADIDYQNLSKDICSIEKVKNIHHIHTWLADEKTVFFEAHVEVDGELKVADTGKIYEKMEHLLKAHYGISHMTIQVEGDVCPEKELFKLG